MDDIQANIEFLSGKLKENRQQLWGAIRLYRIKRRRLVAQLKSAKLQLVAKRYAITTHIPVVSFPGTYNIPVRRK